MALNVNTHETMSEIASNPVVSGEVSTDIHRFPARRLDAARDALRGAHRRLVKAAAKSGQEAPIEPKIVVTREGWASRCTECECEYDGAHGGSCGIPHGVMICHQR
jgi:hypothetical protein